MHIKGNRMFSLPGLGWQRVLAAGWCWLMVIDVDAGSGIVAEG